MVQEKMNTFNSQSVIDEFEGLSKDAISVQNQTLERILEANKEAKYLWDVGLDGKTDVESFRSHVPIVTHEDLEPYIQMIADGNSSPLLTGKPITQISVSSGTTKGKPKYVPFTEELVDSTMQIYRTSYAFRNREFPIGKGKAVQFIYGSKKSTTKGGLTASTATTNVFSSKDFKTTMKDIQSQCSSPDAVIFSSDPQQSLYCHLLCGLLFSDEIQYVSSTFAHSLVNAFRSLEYLYEELCNDIREGVLSSRITIPSMREAMSQLLNPNPNLADNILTKCKNLNGWYGVIPELWPNAKYVYGIMTGSMLAYVKKLRHYAGVLPLVCSDYGASEGWIGANIDPFNPPEIASFAVLPNIGFFEFLPIGDSGSGAPVGVGDVKVGEEYEVVVTNFAGLYRYRLGDIVRIDGFHHQTPLLHYICRRHLLLNISIDKTTEKDLQQAVEKAGNRLATNKIDIIDYTSHIEQSTYPNYYVIFLELDGKPDHDTLQRCSNDMDLSFNEPGYVGSRKSATIGALQVRLLRRGTFQKVLEHYLGLGGAVSQFKTPRCVGVSNSRVLEILNDNVVQKCSSLAFK